MLAYIIDTKFGDLLYFYGSTLVDDIYLFNQKVSITKIPTLVVPVIKNMILNNNSPKIKNVVGFF